MYRTTIRRVASGKIGRAYASGVCPVQIIVLDEDAEAYQFADIFDGFRVIRDRLRRVDL